MKFNRQRNATNKPNAIGLAKTLIKRKERRKQKRLQAKQKKSLFSKRFRRGKGRYNSEDGPTANSPNSKGIKQLQAYAQAEKEKMGILKNKGKKGKGKFQGKGKGGKQNGNQRMQDEESEEEKEEQGFKMSSSVSDRMARLQEYVNQESRKMGTFEEGEGGKKKKNKNQPGPSEETETGKDSMNIQDKTKLKKLQQEIEADDKEIKKLSTLLNLNTKSRKKMVPLLGDDFGSLIQDIEGGHMQHLNKYKNADVAASDSEDELEKDMAMALGQTKVKKKKSKVKETQEDREDEGGSVDDAFDTFENGEDDGDDMEEYEGLGNDDFDAFENGIDVESEEDSDLEYGYGEDRSRPTKFKKRRQAKHAEEESDDDIDYGDDNENTDGEEGELGDIDDGEENGYTNEKADSEDGMFSAEGEWYTDDEEAEEPPKIDYGRLSREREEDFDGEEVQSEEGEEEEENDGFLDAEAMECSDEESEDDGRELVHDIRNEEDFAFEGGSGYYSKPEILKNGQENEIDKYSSNSEDDTDLEDFVVDDEEVEFEDVDDGLPEEEFDDSDDPASDGLSPVKKRKKKRLVVMSDEESGGENEVNGDKESDEERDMVDDVPLNAKTKLKLSTKSPRLIISDEEDEDGDDDSDSDDENIDNVKKTKQIAKNLVPLPTITSEDSDEEKEQPAPKKGKKKNKTNIEDSDEDDGETKNESTTKRKRSALTSEGEEEEEENEEEVPVSSKKKKKASPIASSESEDSDSRSTSNKIKTILKKPTNRRQKKTAPRSNKAKAETNGKRRVSFDLPEVTDEESEDESAGSAEFSADDEDGDGEGIANEQPFEEDFGSEDESPGSAEFSDDGNVDDLTEGDKEKSDSVNNENAEEEEDSLTEDIYGRLRDRDGNIVKREEEDGPGGSQATGGKYIPPALRKLMALNTDEKKKEQLARLKKTLKGLLNRLAESNLGGIANQIEGMYTKFSRNDMSEVLTNLLLESLVGPALTPERLVQEHAMLVAVLSANIGEEVGAHILNEFVLKWNDQSESSELEGALETKELDNLLQFIANLYNFRVMDATLVYGILEKLAETFGEKEVELILMVLRGVGFSLRKDDPLALKSLITKIQGKAAAAEAKSEDNTAFTRIRFMLEVVQAIRNNNMTKVPNYDPTHVEHLKKVLKGFVRKGAQNAPLKVTLEDLLKARECGRWWIVGSAWSGGLIDGKAEERQQELSTAKDADTQFSEKFKERAAKLQLSRPPRINILYIVTEGSEDYLDAFEKLNQLSLPPQQERELFSVILLCAQKGKEYNPFFAYLSNRMCKFDRKYKRLVQFALWDKFKELEDLKQREIANLAKFLSHLIGEDAVNLSVLKTISFMEVEGQTVSFLRQLLISLLLHPAGANTVENIFSQLSLSPKLRLLRQSLRIFIIKFLSSKKQSEDPNHQLLSRRIEMATEILNKGGGVLL
ncbi:nucleolar MIF4G domain-containing protein 1 homolog [Penaeus japonicus]|uniref:nucleolar MIF4G domain-containing protein 1 homolog n=1 Tax=Penaeus japonicus TaxID=27405 RepID=UPI001C70B7EF|nr:nucleolar MIF4G domain-containing protein 1 homolog [Penaeus japonicus]